MKALKFPLGSPELLLNSLANKSVGNILDKKLYKFSPVLELRQMIYGLSFKEIERRNK